MDTILAKKGFKVFDIDIKQIHVSRDVDFFESVFPFRTEADNNSYPPLPVVPISDDDQNLPKSIDFSAEIVNDPLHVLPLPETQQNSPPSTDISTDSIPLIQVPFPESSAENNSSPLPHSNSSTPTLRHSTRVRTQPPWLQDFITNVTDTQDLPAAGIISHCKRVSPTHTRYTPPTFPFIISP